MNIKIAHSWLLEYLKTKATPDDIQKYLSLCGPSVERVEKTADGDYLYDIEITSNRIDCASVVGIAREAAIILTRNGFDSEFVFESKPVKDKDSQFDHPPIEITDPSKLCKRILAVVLKDVEIKESPLYIKQRLTAAGIRPINSVVDITNYVMIEIGHPTHVFDYDRIKSHKLIIRKARDNETITTLDEKTYKLSGDDIVIDDGFGTIIDFPGIMGTANSVVTDNTKNILFFIESNDPVAIRRSSMRYGIRTMAATINEKNPDPSTAEEAFSRGIELYKKIAAAQVSGKHIDIYPLKHAPQTITTTYGFINKKIGVAVDPSQVDDILKGLNFKVQKNKSDEFTVEVPPRRMSDVTIAEDIVEEVARIYGYHNLPNRLSPPRYVKQPDEFEKLFVYQNKIKLFLKHLGLHEVLNYSMISLKMIEGLDLKEENHLQLSNIMSEEIKYLRTTLAPSLLKNVKANEGRKDVLKFFELAKIYIPRDNNLPKEIYKLGLITNTSFDDLKGIVESLLAELQIADYSFSADSHDLYSGTQASVIINGIQSGNMGRLKTVYKQNNEIKTDCFICELDFDALIRNAKVISAYHPLHPYSVIKLDLTIALTPENSYQRFKKTAFERSKLLQNIEFVGLFENKATVRLFFSSSHNNITEEDAKKELAQIMQS